MEQKIIIKRLGFLLLLLPLLGSCTLGHESYKTKKSGILEIGCNEIKDEKYYKDSYFTSCEGSNNQNIDFSVIELDDYGEFWEPDQVTTTLNRIKQNASEKPTVLVTFIHGWRNNASERSPNIKDFRKLARGFSKLECGLLFQSSGSDCISPNISAVYISWRGDPLGLTELTSVDLLKSPQYLSFWNRWRASQKISNTNVTHLLLKLSGMVDEGDRERLERLNYRSCIYADYKTDGNQCSKKIILGHSFGGRILEHAVAQGFIGSRNLANKLDISGFVKDSLNKRDTIKSNVKQISLSTKLLKKEEIKFANSLDSQAIKKAIQDNNIIEKNQKLTNKKLELNKIKDQGEYQAIGDVFNNYIKSSFDVNFNLIKSFVDNECLFYQDLSTNYLIDDEIKNYYKSVLDCQDNSITKSDELDELSKETQLVLISKSCSVIKSINNNFFYKNIISASDKKISKTDKCIEDNTNQLRQLLNNKTNYKNNLVSIFANENYINFDLYFTQNESFPKQVLEELSKYNKTNSDSIDTLEFQTSQHSDDLEKLNKKEFMATWTQQPQVDVAPVTHKMEDTIDEYIKSFNNLSKEISGLTKDIEKQNIRLTELKHQLDILNKEISFNEIRLTDYRKQLSRLSKDKAKSIQELNTLAERFENLAYSIYQRPYDLAVLLNPANEALSTNMLVSAMCDSANYYKTRNKLRINPDPWMIAISSVNDTATGYIYKAATRLYTNTRISQERPQKVIRKSPFVNSSFNCRENELTQYELAHTPAPFFDELNTHKLISYKKSLSPECADEFNVSSKKAEETIGFGLTQGFRYQNKLNNHHKCQQTAQDKENKKSKNLKTEELLIGSFDNQFLKLTTHDSVKNYDVPDFWAFKVQKNIIKDHNDIFNSRVGKLLGSLVKKFKSIGEQCLIAQQEESMTNRNSNVCIFLNDPFLSKDPI